MFKQVRELIKEKEAIISRENENFEKFTKEMIRVLEVETGVEFTAVEDVYENILKFYGVVEENYLYFSVSLEDYSIVDLEDQTDDQNYIDILFEIKEGLGL